MKSIVFTMDVDWANEDVIRYSLIPFIENKVPLGIFLTHKSQAIEQAERLGNFEFGMHPNFYPRSTHGSDITEVITHCHTLRSGLKVSRSHGLMFSSNILIELGKQNVARDLSVLSPLAEPILPIEFKVNDNLLRRYSFNWEDDMFFHYSNSEFYYSVKNINLNTMVVNFHPIHIYLNSSNTLHYENYKKGVNTRNDSVGAETFLYELIEEVKAGNMKPLSLTEYFTLMDSSI